MKMDGSVKIAGDRTVDDWDACKAALIVGGDPEAWTKACEQFFVERLRTRYFDPINALQSSKLLKGEGFSIVTIQCSLIEFLGSIVKGKSYIYRPNKKIPLATFEYDNSKSLFVEFLTTAHPFEKIFTKTNLATEFYEAVRCGLLHEARTKKGWRILESHPSGIAVDAKVVYRNDLQNAFEKFVKWYKTELPKDKDLQEAFVRKFDSLCQE
jgi:hypothetical protein